MFKKSILHIVLLHCNNIIQILKTKKAIGNLLPIAFNVYRINLIFYASLNPRDAGETGTPAKSSMRALPSLSVI